jgi:hypothetical protein
MKMDTHYPRFVKPYRLPFPYEPDRTMDGIMTKEAANLGG